MHTHRPADIAVVAVVYRAPGPGRWGREYNYCEQSRTQVVGESEV